MPSASPTSKEQELEKKLTEINVKASDDQYQALAQKLGLPFSDLTSAPIDSEALSIIPEAEARRGQLAPILRTGHKLTVALLDPERPETKAILDSFTKKGYSFELIITSPQSLEHVLARYKSIKTQATFEIGSMDVEEKAIEEFQGQINSLDDIQNQVKSISVTKLLEILIAGGLKMQASDIHFEPGQNETRLRYRLDGVLNDIATIEKPTYQSVVSRIKVLSKLKLNITKAPQDGRFTIRKKNTDIEVRVSVLPSEYGETIVMRLLNPETTKEKLEELGIREDLLVLIKSQLDKPTGAILTTGPTGSGKTTTLYSFINYLNSSGSKIITIEDPIEYHISGISQTQVDPTKGYTFANGLRAIVRQDPDIILVGEIRDAETAEIALHAALTGHLVLSTIHTNDAAGTIPRLLDLGIKSQIIAPAVRIAMAQRLVRRLCPDCRKEAAIPAEDIKELKSSLEPIKDRVKIPEISETTKMYLPVGCQNCNNIGYKGRIGVYEAFVISREMEKLIMSTPAISDIQDLAIKEGMITMLQDAYLKLLAGVTSLEEIRRILG